MVEGFKLFSEHFRDMCNQFVLIGGVATMHWLEKNGLQGRSTKDLDVVLLLENFNTDFNRLFWDFIRKGDYEMRQKNTGHRIHYRFSHPKDTEYPSMIELFSRMPDHLFIDEEMTVVPIHGDDNASSLSAILMDDDYYEIVRKNVQIENDMPILDPIGLILLKVRAWLDLTEKKESGGIVDSRDIKKHRTDIFKLCQLLSPTTVCVIPTKIHEDVNEFMSHFQTNSPEWPGILQAIYGNNKPELNPDEFIHVLANSFSSQN